MNTPKKFSIPKNLLDCFHSKESFKRYGLKQASTWLGLVIFMCFFGKDVITLVHNILTDIDLASKIAGGLAGVIMVLFDKLKGD